MAARKPLFWIPDFHTINGQILAFSGDDGHYHHHGETVFYLERVEAATDPGAHKGWRQRNVKHMQPQAAYHNTQSLNEQMCLPGTPSCFLCGFLTDSRRRSVCPVVRPRPELFEKFKNGSADGLGRLHWRQVRRPGNFHKFRAGNFFRHALQFGGRGYLIMLAANQQTRDMNVGQKPGLIDAHGRRHLGFDHPFRNLAAYDSFNLGYHGIRCSGRKKLFGHLPNEVANSAILDSCNRCQAPLASLRRIGGGVSVDKNHRTRISAKPREQRKEHIAPHGEPGNHARR